MDIVEELRGEADATRNSLMSSAADEIERLRALLQESLGLIPDGGSHAIDYAMRVSDLLAAAQQASTTVDDVPNCGSENDWRKGR